MHHEHLRFDGAVVRTPLRHRVLLVAECREEGEIVATASVTGGGDVEFSGAYGFREFDGLLSVEQVLDAKFVELTGDPEGRLVLRIDSGRSGRAEYIFRSAEEGTSLQLLDIVNL